jgi:hypothetical protein
MLSQRNRPHVSACILGNDFRLIIHPRNTTSDTDFLNNAYHYGMGMIAGTTPAIMSYCSVIDLVALFVHTATRILID